MARFLICVSDTQLFLMLRHILAMEGISSDLVASPAELTSAIEHSPIDGLIIDWSNPTGCGEAFVRVARAAVPKALIVLLSRNASFNGMRPPTCDLLLTRPFNPEALLDFLHQSVDGQGSTRRVIRRGTVLRYADLEMNLATMIVSRAGRSLYLSPLQFRLLRRLLLAQAHICDRDDLIRHCWPRAAVVEPRTVDIHIGHLRRALSGDKLGFIRTIRGRGYALRLPSASD